MSGSSRSARAGRTAACRSRPVQIAAAGSAVQIAGRRRPGAPPARRVRAGRAQPAGALAVRPGGRPVRDGRAGPPASEGRRSAPDVRGTVSLEDASLRLRLLPQAMTSLQARIVFDGRSLRVPEATAVMGGGDLKLAGEAQLAGGLADAQFTITARDVTLAYPPGLRSRLEADLTLSGGPEAYLLAGDVRAMRGLYDLDLVFEQSLTAPQAASSDSPALRRIALDLRVEIQNPIQVRNNMTDLQAVGSMTVRGDMTLPRPPGSLEHRAGRQGLPAAGARSRSRAGASRIAATGTRRSRSKPPISSRVGRQQPDERIRDHRPADRLAGAARPAAVVRSSALGRADREPDRDRAHRRRQRRAARGRGRPGRDPAGRAASRAASASWGSTRSRSSPSWSPARVDNETGARFTFGKRLTAAPRAHLLAEPAGARVAFHPARGTAGPGRHRCADSATTPGPSPVQRRPAPPVRRTPSGAVPPRPTGAFA